MIAPCAFIEIALELQANSLAAGWKMLDVVLNMQANGFAAGWEHARDQDKLHASSTFFDILTVNHSYASGGSNNGEFWGPPQQVADAVTGVSHLSHHVPLPLQVADAGTGWSGLKFS